jgi:GABA(A) receptor-associated protein
MSPFSNKRFIDKFTFFERTSESSKIMKKYTDRIPVICEKNIRDTSIPDIDKHKYLVPHDLTVGQFIYVVRKRIRLPANSALFLFVGDHNTLLPNNLYMDEIYARYRNLDGFLYIMYSKENVFG